MGGFSIVDSFNTPAVNGAYVNTIPIDTRYGGGCIPPPSPAQTVLMTERKDSCSRRVRVSIVVLP